MASCVFNLCLKVLWIYFINFCIYLIFDINSLTINKCFKTGKKKLCNILCDFWYMLRPKRTWLRLRICFILFLLMLVRPPFFVINLLYLTVSLIYIHMTRFCASFLALKNVVFESIVYNISWSLIFAIICFIYIWFVLILMNLSIVFLLLALNLFHLSIFWIISFIFWIWFSDYEILIWFKLS